MESRKCRIGSCIFEIVLKESAMSEVARTLEISLTLGEVAMKLALVDIDPEEMALETGPGSRSLESVLGEATMALRETLISVCAERLPEVPDGFEARFARWGTGITPDEFPSLLPVVFAEHAEALVEALHDVSPQRFDEPADPPAAFDEDSLFSFTTLEEMICAASSYIHFLAGEASVIRLGLGKPAARDLFDELDSGAYQCKSCSTSTTDLRSKCANCGGELVWHPSRQSPTERPESSSPEAGSL